MSPKLRSRKPRRDESPREETPACDDFAEQSDEASEEASEEDNEEGDQPRVSDPYGLLGVKSDATPAEIKTAYKKLALRNHPGMRPSFPIRPSPCSELAHLEIGH